ncbi:tRNA-dihydrouridine(47) synthase [NAD(P)(+)]-like isoform X1 [Chiloscyllium plagiosum]|uniref:tRNA-dihydrouridine(47) synthase [NAD(P)(+)]-like isoform X1 n=1 Tax=Chiloscyllium plagiosum TaxID=36176 RepID=UPI001CB863A3|nr:tRNA-dihydrouridine(47) synthase [NAD(P)(+)]-like isoform X1 [Chiloscyllium plagiosum]XP_043546229.1 tRNA-dihydrouridine(47) synthase [NAD(P)(+)]-like isoform X1 [Chiloscyllium plagiosum]XP_043546230.1 tRNA-dihydrouridine(47) synthase [NAD(P)(+)]-like isoform X1 [Chiloscyllium plagiosum]
MAESGDATNSANEAVSDPGVAAIKLQYRTTKDHFHEYINSERDKNLKLADKDHPNDGEVTEGAADCDLPEHKAKRMKLDENSENIKSESEKDNSESCQKEEEHKQINKKARGQNKNRPHMKPKHYEHDQKLCTSVCQEPPMKCYFGEKCRFLHDVSKYLESKPSDLGDHCHLYATYGRCQYGVTCRYAKSHIGPNNKNLINEDLTKTWEGTVIVKNSLSKDLQQILRKKKFHFDKSEQYLKQLNKGNKCENHSNAAKKTFAQSKCIEEKVITSNSTEMKLPIGISDRVIEEKDSSVGSQDCIKAELQSVFYSENTLNNGQEPESTQVNVEINEMSTFSGTDTDIAKSIKDDNEGIISTKTLGVVTDEDIIKVRSCEKKQLNFKDKLYLAPLTTCGNLPFRRICKRFGADITCGEMAMCIKLLQGQSSEWALLKRHYTEDLFGVQLEGAFPDTMTKCAELLNQNIDVDFVDINVGCPIDLVYHKGGGCGLMNRLSKLEQIVKGMTSVLDVPLTAKLRTGLHEKINIAHKIIPNLRDCGLSLVTLHGRSREQRYTKLSDWEYIDHCAQLANPMPLFGNGDILSFEDANRVKATTSVSGIMIARGALIKPWIFTEIKEQRHWDISSRERFEILQDFRNYGLEHWESDTQGVEKSRKFLLEWLSFLCRYIPIGLLERIPQKINERPPYYLGRDYLETLMASQNVSDWIKISEMLLGPVPPNFSFLPKHKANSYK